MLPAQWKSFCIFFLSVGHVQLISFCNFFLSVGHVQFDFHSSSQILTLSPSSFDILSNVPLEPGGQGCMRTQLIFDDLVILVWLLEVLWLLL